MGLMDDWSQVLRVEAASYARLALTNIKREFPSGVWHEMTAPGDFPFRPRARTPVFYGSFDWHSCVQMHWLLVRLLRVAPGEVPADEIRVALGAHFEPVALAVEEDFIVGPGRVTERPYGWGWVLTLIHETATWDDQYGRKWASAMAPLGDKITGLYLDWLGGATYPVRYGVHENSANGMSRALPYATARARAGDSRAAGRDHGQGLRVVRGRPDLPGRLGAVGTRLPVAGAGRGRADGARAAGGGAGRLAGHVPARHRGRRSRPRCSPR